MNAFSKDHPRSAQAVVAIPAHNEADWIVRCLTALSRQKGRVFSQAVLLVNNSIDRTASIARELQPVLSFPVEVIEHQFAAEHQTAGQARRMAMERAARWTADDGVLLCTDADGQVAPDWLSANLFHMRAGADAVAGRAIIDPVDAAAIPAILHEDDARECAYAALLDEIDSLLDPCADDPWPRHTEHSGASICVTHDAFRRAGGIPPLPVGEDRAFFAALRRIDARLRHAIDVEVTVSGRIDGRATGGMADTIRRRLVAPDLFLDDALEPVAARILRARSRRWARQLFAGRGRMTTRMPVDIGCTTVGLEEALGQATFGLAWEMIEARATRLARVPVPTTALPHETARAKAILKTLQAGQGTPGHAGMQRRSPKPAQPPISQQSETSRMAG